MISVAKALIIYLNTDIYDINLLQNSIFWVAILGSWIYRHAKGKGTVAYKDTVVPLYIHWYQYMYAYGGHDA